MSRARTSPPVVLFPGAGSGRDHPSLVAIADAIGSRPCVRADFPYRRAGRRAPDRPPVLLQAVVDEVAALATRRRPVLGGRSMGGRICSLAVADGLVRARGLVLIAYPLHPPGRPDRLRVEHFARIGVPCLFVSGTRDEFATPDELRTWTATIPAPVDLVLIDGGRHELRGAELGVAQAVRAWLDRL